MERGSPSPDGADAEVDDRDRGGRRRRRRVLPVGQASASVCGVASAPAASPASPRSRSTGTALQDHRRRSASRCRRSIAAGSGTRPSSAIASVDVEVAVGDEVIASHPFVERGQQRQRILDDVVATDLDPVHEPLGELELGVQTCTLADESIRSAGDLGGIRPVDVIGSGRGRRKPLQIGRGVAHLKTMPFEKARHVGSAVDILEEEGCRACTAEHHGRLEAPQDVGIDSASPSVEQRRRRLACRVGPIDESCGCRPGSGPACVREAPPS